MSKQTDRRNQLIDIIKSKNGASVKELSRLLEVSEMTIRRDLLVLEQDKIIKNVYGAAIYNPENKKESTDQTYELTSALVTRDAEKRKIGAFAASLIEPEDILVIDTGSTTEMLAQHIDDHLEATVLCYNANILNSLRLKENLSLIFAGGKYHPKTQMVESVEGNALIGSMRFTKAFVSAAGIHQSLGVTCACHYEIATKKSIMQSSIQKILLVDSSKFDQVKPAYFAEVKDFDVIITDTSLSPEWKHYIEDLNIKLYTVS